MGGVTCESFQICFSKIVTPCTSIQTLERFNSVTGKFGLRMARRKYKVADG
jgi:hypothetical protein